MIRSPTELQTGALSLLSVIATVTDTVEDLAVVVDWSVATTVRM